VAPEKRKRKEMNTIALVENGNVVAVGLFFGNGEETVKEILAGTPLQNVVRTIVRDNGEVVEAVLADHYFLWSAKEYLQDVIATYPERYSKHGNTIVIVSQSELMVRFAYTTNRGYAEVTVEVKAA
jgi:hypothetical protein